MQPREPPPGAAARPAPPRARQLPLARAALYVPGASDPASEAAFRPVPQTFTGWLPESRQGLRSARTRTGRPASGRGRDRGGGAGPGTGESGKRAALESWAAGDSRVTPLSEPKPFQAGGENPESPSFEFRTGHH